MTTDVANTEREKDIYDQYQSVIAYFIAELEVRDAEYPIEIFNEIRAIFTHLARYRLQDSPADLFAAERHVKRAILDCFKYMCISIKEEIRTFREGYRKVDLSIADNGNFLMCLNRLEKEADRQYIMAKKLRLRKRYLKRTFIKCLKMHIISMKDFVGSSMIQARLSFLRATIQKIEISLQRCRS